MPSQSFIRPEQLWHDVGLRAGQTVAHLGCGPGFYLIPAAKIVGATGKAIGVDVQAQLLAEAESRAAREGVGDIVYTVRGNIENQGGSTLPEQSADWVLVANILHQAPPAKVLAEAARIVKENGRVIVVEWSPGASPFGPPIEARIAKPEAVAAAEGCGLTIVREWQPSAYHYGLILGYGAAI